MFEIVEKELAAVLKVIGVGGGGGNALNTMIEAGLEGVEFIATNTDKQALSTSMAPCKVQLGPGLGAGGNPDRGRECALESKDRIREHFEDSNMIFITAGMGGGTGTGAAPIIAQVAKDLDCLTVAVVTKPFLFEGKRRTRQAEEGIAELRKCVDTLITIPNQKLLGLAGKDMTLLNAFKKADEVLLQAVRSISDLIIVPGLVNLDFADVKTVMADRGLALMGTGFAKGENRAIEAANMAISNPLLENIAIEGASGVLINITGCAEISLMEINEATSLIQDAVSPEANIIFGAVIDEKMKDAVRITVIASGFDMPAEEKRPETTERRVSFLQESMSRRKEQLKQQGRSSVLEKYRTTPPLEEDAQPMPKAATADQTYRTTTKCQKSDSEEDEYDIPTFLRRQAD